MVKTSTRYPPSTGYRKPTKRKFYVWEDRHIIYGNWGLQHGWTWHPWRWCCTLCEPPAFGFRARGGYAAVMAFMPHHFARRQAHHDWTRRNHA